MFGLGVTEILVLAVLALVLIGPDQLPALARDLARFLNDLKRTTNDFTHDLKNQMVVPTILPLDQPADKKEEDAPSTEGAVAGAHHSTPAQYPVPETRDSSGRVPTPPPSGNTTDES
ncbi:MAG: twin-arginine translocase TatA/TatE family subunit [Bdellovibrionota bacterium]